MAYFTSYESVYMVAIILAGVLFLLRKQLHDKLKVLEAIITERLPAPQATAVNAVLETADHLVMQSPQQNISDMLSVLEKLVEIGVINANVQVVNQAKSAGLFYGSVAASVKRDVVSGVLDNLGGIKDALDGHLGDVAGIAGQMVEKYVIANKA